MSTEIITTLDELAARFGIVIDWSAENVMPLVERAIQRLTSYEIMMGIIDIVGSIAFLIAVLITARWLITQYRDNRLNKEDTWLWDHYTKYSEPTMPCIAIIGAICAVGIIAVLSLAIEIKGLLQWIMAPEMALVEHILDALPSAS